MKVIQQSENLFNVVEEGSSRKRLDSPLLIPLSFGKLSLQNRGTRRRIGRKRRRRKSICISEPRKIGRVIKTGTFFYLITFLTKKGSLIEIAKG